MASLAALKTVDQNKVFTDLRIAKNKISVNASEKGVFFIALALVPDGDPPILDLFFKHKNEKENRSLAAGFIVKVKDKANLPRNSEVGLYYSFVAEGAPKELRQLQKSIDRFTQWLVKYKFDAKELLELNKRFEKVVELITLVKSNLPDKVAEIAEIEAKFLNLADEVLKLSTAESNLQLRESDAETLPLELLEKVQGLRSNVQAFTGGAADKNGRKKGPCTESNLVPCKPNGTIGCTSRPDVTPPGYYRIDGLRDVCCPGQTGTAPDKCECPEDMDLVNRVCKCKTSQCSCPEGKVWVPDSSNSGGSCQEIRPTSCDPKRNEYPRCKAECRMQPNCIECDLSRNSIIFIGSQAKCVEKIECREDEEAYYNQGSRQSECRKKKDCPEGQEKDVYGNCVIACPNNSKRSGDTCICNDEFAQFDPVTRQCSCGNGLVPGSDGKCTCPENTRECEGWFGNNVPAVMACCGSGTMCEHKGPKCTDCTDPCGKIERNYPNSVCTNVPSLASDLFPGCEDAKWSCAQGTTQCSTSYTGEAICCGVNETCWDKKCRTCDLVDPCKPDTCAENETCFSATGRQNHEGKDCHGEVRCECKKANVCGENCCKTGEACSNGTCIQCLHTTADCGLSPEESDKYNCEREQLAPGCFGEIIKTCKNSCREGDCCSSTEGCINDICTACDTNNPCAPEKIGSFCQGGTCTPTFDTSASGQTCYTGRECSCPNGSPCGESGVCCSDSEECSPETNTCVAKQTAQPSACWCGDAGPGGKSSCCNSGSCINNSCQDEVLADAECDNAKTLNGERLFCNSKNGIEEKPCDDKKCPVVTCDDDETLTYPGNECECPSCVRS